MSWDGLMFKVPTGTSQLDELPSDFKPEAIGSPQVVFSCLKTILPNQLHKLGYTSWHDDTGFLEITYETEVAVESLGIRTSASATAFEVMKQICEFFRIVLLDIQEMRFCDFAGQTLESRETYRAFANKVLEIEAHDEQLQ